MNNNFRPNILWFCTDQQRFDTIRALGNKCINTPNLDRLIKEGVTFTNAFTQSPVCTPSRACFLTGRYPKTTLARQNGNDYFPSSERLITKMLADEGFDCGLAGKFHLSAAQGRVEPRLDDGYKEYQWSHDPFPVWDVEDNRFLAWLKEKGKSFKELYPVNPENPDDIGWGMKDNPIYPGFPTEYHQTTWCTEKAIDFIRKSKGKPWLMSINTFDPHHPFDPPQEYLDRYNPDDMQLPLYQPGELDNKPEFQRKDHLGAYNGQGISYANMSDYQHRQIVAAYYGMIELIDDSFGKILRALEETGQRDNTLIIFMSDHGEMLGDHGIFCKGPYFYDQLIHVPLILSWPKGFLKDVKINTMVELVDIVPTLLELMGMEIPQGIQGKSFLPYCTDINYHAEHKESVYCEYYNALKSHKTYATMVRNKRYKIVVYHGMELGELYDLKKDPNEFENLWNEPAYVDVKAMMMKECFDRSVFATIDPLPRRIGGY